MSLHVVTGAFGYSGKYITARLLASGQTVRTLTDSPQRANPFGEAVTAVPFNFERPDELAASLEGVDVLYNTYWVRFDHKNFTFRGAVENTITLFEAARRAGVGRVVHVSITNPTEDSDLEYFSGKARLERELQQSGLSYAILRPTVLFGSEDILVNNIAWVLRRTPVFGVFGSGDYRLQPIFVDDLAQLAVEQGRMTENVTIDAIGPETFTYREMVGTIARAIGKRRLIVPMPVAIGYLGALVIGKLLGDVIVTRDEITGLMRGLLATNSEPAGQTALTDWARQNAHSLGRTYKSELARRRDRRKEYC